MSTAPRTCTLQGGTQRRVALTRTAHTLVTEGPYRWVRHPFYLSALAGGVGTALLSASLLIRGTQLDAKTAVDSIYKYTDMLATMLHNVSGRED